jgi:VIT family protein
VTTRDKWPPGARDSPRPAPPLTAARRGRVAGGVLPRALLPLLPYLLGLPALLTVSLVITAVALLGGGMVVGRLTGRPLLAAGARQLTLGALAVAVTFAVGDLIGASTT